MQTGKLEGGGDVSQLGEIFYQGMQESLTIFTYSVSIFIFDYQNDNNIGINYYWLRI